jgi:hypothetical protein
LKYPLPIHVNKTTRGHGGTDGTVDGDACLFVGTTFPDDGKRLEIPVWALLLKLPQNANGNFVFAMTVAEG